MILEHDEYDVLPFYSAMVEKKALSDIRTIFVKYTFV